MKPNVLERVTNHLEREVARRPCRLRVAFGTNAGAEVSLPPVGVVLGADPACDVVLEDRAVSRRHATVVPADGGFMVTDLESRNGVWVDGVAITSALVPVGTTLRIGTTMVELLPAEETVAIEPSESMTFGGMFGESRARRMAFALLERASRSNAPILLTGETGTGKELAARAVHDNSPQHKGPFVVFDCGAASETLIEGELFGHKRGAFTGAHADRSGAFALAHGGTLFLDEIGDLPFSLQAKLLRLLECGEVTPLGGKKTEKYDVRIVAATHRDLWAEVAQGTFRGDLYYRLAVVEVHLPPLRQRREDIPTLVTRFLRSNGAREEGVEGRALDKLLDYGWPGNVRELRNVVARAAALSAPGARFDEMPILLRAARGEGSAGGSDLSAFSRADKPYHDAKSALLDRFEKEYLADLLRRAENNVSQAARIAGLERKYLYRVLERAGMLADRLASRARDDDNDG